jgi:hypothetical protein
MAYDPKTHRLFVAALENGSLEVVDVSRGSRVGSIRGLEEPQGVVGIPEQSCVAVACGGDGRLCVFDARTFRLLHSIQVGFDADNVRIDSRTGRLFVAVGDLSTGALVEIDTRTWSRLREIRFATHPESFQLDPDGDRIYVNLPGGVRSLRDGAVAFASRRTGSVTDILQLPGRGRNFPMTLDAAAGRLFIATRRPARLIEIDVATRKIRSETECADDCDDLYFDAAKNRLILSCGGFRPDLQAPSEASLLSLPGRPGCLDLFEAQAVGPTRVDSAPTGWHARTCLFVPSLRTVFVALPLHEGRAPEIRRYLLK